MGRGERGPRIECMCVCVCDRGSTNLGFRLFTAYEAVCGAGILIYSNHQEEWVACDLGSTISISCSYLDTKLCLRSRL